MKARVHRGSFSESMSTTQEISGTIESIREYFSPWNENLTVAHYRYGIDPRNGWNTHIVKDKHGVVGFTDGMPAGGFMNIEELESALLIIKEGLDSYSMMCDEDDNETHLCDPDKMGEASFVLQGLLDKITCLYKVIDVQE